MCLLATSGAIVLIVKRVRWQEEGSREERQRVVASDLELEQVASELRTQIATVTESVHTVERQIADIASDEANLEGKSCEPLPVVAPLIG